jgi:hypothetical protein
MGKDREEFLAAISARRVEAAAVCLQLPANRLQNRIAGGVPMQVIDAFKEVEVDQDAGERLPARRHAVPFAFELGHQRAAIGQPGQPVVPGLAAQLRHQPLVLPLDLLPLHRIAHGAHQDLWRALALGEIILRAALQGFQGQRVVGQAGEHDDRQIGIARIERGHSIQAEAVGQR